MNLSNKIVCFLILSSLMSVAIAAENSTVTSRNSEKFILEMYTPKYAGLLGNLNAGTSKSKKEKTPTVIKASSVKIEVRNSCTVHMGYYTDSMIMTIMEDPTEQLSIGTQAITMGTTPISISTHWTQEVISGILYIKHIHDGCYVYSTDFSQFVVFK